MSAKGTRAAPNLNERLHMAVERYANAKDADDRNIANLARRVGVSHSTVRKELRRLGYLPPQKQRQPKHDDPNRTDCGPACPACRAELDAEIEQSEQKKEGGF